MLPLLLIVCGFFGSGKFHKYLEMWPLVRILLKHLYKLQNAKLVLFFFSHFLIGLKYVHATFCCNVMTVLETHQDL